MATIEMTESDFESTVGENEIVLVDWWASWCGPCRMFAPVYEASSEKHPDVVFGKVDTEANPSLSAAARISSIPTLMAFRDGIMVFSQPGALPAEGLEKVIQAVRDLDMDDIRRQLQEQVDAAQREAALDVEVSDFADRIGNPGVTVLDVRTPAEYASGHLPGAVLMDVQGSDFGERMKQLDSDAEYAIYCRSGNRSKQALRILLANGFSNAYHLDGGVLAWQEAGRELVAD